MTHDITQLRELAAKATDMTVEQRCQQYSDAQLLECCLQVYARSCMYATKDQHDAALAYRDELLRRLAAANADLAALRDGIANIMNYTDRMADLALSHEEQDIHDQYRGFSVVLGKLAATHTPTEREGE